MRCRGGVACGGVVGTGAPHYRSETRCFCVCVAQRRCSGGGFSGGTHTTARCCLKRRDSKKKLSSARHKYQSACGEAAHAQATAGATEQNVRKHHSPAVLDTYSCHGPVRNGNASCPELQERTRAALGRGKRRVRVTPLFPPLRGIELTDSRGSAPQHMRRTAVSPKNIADTVRDRVLKHTGVAAWNGPDEEKNTKQPGWPILLLLGWLGSE